MIQALSLSSYGAALLFMQLLVQMPTPYPPERVFTGADSYVEQPSISVASTPAEWNADWQRHMNVTPIGNIPGVTFPTAETPPSFDFDKYELVVIFGGLAPVGGYSVVDSIQKDDHIYLRLQTLSLNPNGGPTPSSIKANPYAFIVYKRTPLPIVVEFPTQLQDGSIQWNKVAQVGGSHQAGNSPQG